MSFFSFSFFLFFCCFFFLLFSFVFFFFFFLFVFFSFFFFFLALSGLSLARVPMEKASVPRVTLSYASQEWRIFRLFIAIKGLVGGVNIFLPTLLVLTFVGKEDKLGIIGACTSLLSILFMYI